MEPADTSSASASTSDRRPTACDIPERRPFYKWLDRVLSRLHLRHVPVECATHVLDRNAPKMQSEDDPKGLDARIWSQIYGAAIDLITHDDNLNWQKFYHLVYLNAGLFTAFVLSYSGKASAPRIIFPILGIVFGFLFDLTLQEGMRCLRAHRAKVEALDRKMGKPEGFLFLQNSYNHRDALEIGPLLFVVGWVALSVITICAWLLRPEDIHV